MMAANSIGTLELDKLKFHEQDLLDVIDSLRSQGLGQHVSLPQLIVCGDQSAGKSSVLEAISGIPFPQNDGLCTVFATEMILRKSDKFNVTVRISPDPDTASTRSDAELQRLLDFGGSYGETADFQSIIENSKDAMGISKSKTFSNDRLRIGVSGPDLTSLTIVDLPGLFHAGENSDPVQTMVRKYMENPRSVILAVVSAKNDIANQIVLKLTKDFDSAGLRTIGIITKPDTLSVGSANESKILSLVRNEDSLFRLQYGWHILKNRSFEEADTSSQERDDAEVAFFSQGVWKGVMRTHAGINTLRPRLNLLLLSQIKKELPKLTGDIESAIENHQRDLEKLGDSRGTIEEQRAYLTKISQLFQSIVNAAVDGTYSKVFFKDSRTKAGYDRRLRAVVQNMNNNFEEEMRTNGHRFDITDEPPAAESTSSHSSAESVASSSSELDASRATIVSRDDFCTNVIDILKRSRGRELPGMFNPLILADLFKEQSEPWEELCNGHVVVVIRAVENFLDETISHLADVKVSERILQEIIHPAMDQLSQSTLGKLQDVLRSSQELHPITYNHYFTQTFEKIKARRQNASITAAVSKFFGTTSNSKKTITFNPNALISALSNAQKEPDMDKFAALELIDYMEAYYKVALKTTVDNVAVQVVEEALIQKLQDILSPVAVGGMDVSFISRIVGESQESQAMREELKKTLKVLREGLNTCKPFAVLTKKVDPTHSRHTTSGLSGNPKKEAQRNSSSRGTGTSLVSKVKNPLPSHQGQ